VHAAAQQKLLMWPVKPVGASEPIIDQLALAHGPPREHRKPAMRRMCRIRFAIACDKLMSVLPCKMGYITCPGQSVPCFPQETTSNRYLTAKSKLMANLPVKAQQSAKHPG